MNVSIKYKKDIKRPLDIEKNIESGFNPNDSLNHNLDSKIEKDS